jgi:branched-chain amino acid transport system substrate-binding protein
VSFKIGIEIKKRGKLLRAISKMIYGLIAIAIVVVAAVAAYVYWPKGTTTTEPIKLGAELPLTPPGSYVSGAEMKMGMELAVKEINDAGGVTGRNISLFIEDDNGKPEGGTSAMQKLISSDGVVAVVGAFHSSVTLAAMEVAHTYQIPYLTLAEWSNTVTEKNYSEVFRLGLCNAIHFSNAGKFLVEQNRTKVAIVVENTDFGLGAADEVKKVLDAHNITYQQFSLDMSTADFTSIIGTIKGMNADAVVNVFTGPAGYTLVAQLYDAGIAPSHSCILCYPLDEAIAPEYWTTLGDKGKYVVVYTMFHPAITLSSKTAAVITKFNATYNRMPTVVVFQAYDGIYTMCEAIRQAESTNAATLIQKLEGMDYTGVLGRIQFSMGAQSGDPIYMFHNMKNPPDLFLEYNVTSQLSTEAPVVWPSQYANSPYITPP